MTETYRGPSGKGPRIVAIGGGTGLSTMLRGLKRCTNNITAIVTVADDGGGSGVLRQELGMLPPGDIRNCLEALANVEPVMSELLHYRFTEGSLRGQSFGNLFLAALNGISGSFDQAVSRMSQVLAITGTVLPVTNVDVQLEAEFENGARVLGESKIFYCKKREECRVQRVRLLPEHPAALPEALNAIRNADMILLGPGSLYTSVIPNLLVDGITEAISASDALKIYIGNVMTQEGETEGYTHSDHIRALFEHSAPGLFSLCLVNHTEIPAEVQKRYAVEGAEPVRCDKDVCAELGVELISRPVACVTNGLVRHDGDLLAAAILDLHAQRSVRIAGQGRYRKEQAQRRDMMSFSGDVKNELCRGAVSRDCCACAEVYGVLLCCNTFTPREIRIITESEAFAQRLPKLLERAFGMTFDRLPAEDEHKFIFQITDAEKLNRIVDSLGYDPHQSSVLHINFGLLEDECCRGAFLRGVFLSGGSVTDPSKHYHLELATSHAQASRELQALLNEMGHRPRQVTRGGYQVTYFKNCDQIEDFITAIGAPLSAMELMNLRVEKDLRNDINRRVNCEAANLGKAVDAAQEQLTAIRLLYELDRVKDLPDKLKETIVLREAYPELTLAELAAEFDPPVSKSCLNHRLRKLVELSKQ